MFNSERANKVPKRFLTNEYIQYVNINVSVVINYVFYVYVLSKKD